MCFIWIQATFPARYPTMLHSALLKTTIKKTPNCKYSSPMAQQSPQASARKAHISWAHSEPALFIQPWHLSTGEWGIAWSQSRDRISTSGSAQVPPPSAHLSHLQNSRVTMLEPSSPLLPALPPWSLCPALPSHPEPAHRKQAEATAECCISSLLDTTPSLKFQARLSHPLASSQWFPGYPVLSAQNNCMKLHTLEGAM